MKPARILLADDHELVREGLRRVLARRDDWEICGEAGNGSEALELTRKLQPDLAIVDFAMPEMNGLEVARQILAESSDTEVLLLTMHESDGLVREALAAGVRGFVLKSDAGRELVHAVETLLQHKPAFTGKVAQMVLTGYLNPAEIESGSAQDRLTRREREVVQLLAEGKSSKEAADVLGISVNTAETHRSNVMRKLNLHSVADLVRYAIRNGLAQP